MKTDILASFPAMMANVREKEPIVQAITNFVTVNDCANIIFWLLYTSLDQLAKENPKYQVDKEAVLHETIEGGWVTFAGKGATEFGICSTLARLVFCVFHDEKAVMPVSTQLNGQYGQHDLCLLYTTRCV